MIFRTLNADEYENFALTHPGRYYINSSKMLETKRENGWDVFYTGVTDEQGKILAAAGFSKVPVAGFFHYAYAQRGILCDFANQELTAFFTKELKKFLKENGMAYMRMDPYVEYQQLNDDGSVTEGGFNRQDIIDSLKSLGYAHMGFTTGYSADSQVRYMVVLDLEGKDDKAITAGYEPNTRRTINRARKFGVEIEECDVEHLDEFMKLMDFTSEKRHFADLGLKAYQSQMKAFGRDDAKVWLAVLDTDKLIRINMDDLKTVQEEAEKTNAALEKTPNNGKLLRRRKEEEERIAQIEKMIRETEELKNTHGSRIILSGAYFVIYDGEMCYISSGSYDELRKYCGPYLIQDEAIRLAIQRGCTRYNFTGTSGVFNESADDYGVFEFKRKLGGRPIELIGEFRLDADPAMIRRINALNKIKKIIRK
ncbi:MAG: peptidoglycan bridge formation glycyltransferase FemA/FemB family protein [Solobacterium sp.]|nr:peptidoglycan bridge formation glycyltransferase FemA/FemB family protein [Solobacterium sp.]